ncbi:alpha/beta hydrolase [Acinetobacter rathckeae]|uniref:alpha/beta hydrolase n=1 Tax=Acinetobacter rathckeae TaxID=2605272 RepID=UPI0018A2ADCE|nr:alpha/beta hydrolase [Acinetobacter rathckeae]MBF7686874.1 alpha/beta hydrolase [Acinetobacter rathckeae]MBF7694722.1 alpha/beta hydrolase [Acinetobacter rathckeae]
MIENKDIIVLVHGTWASSQSWSACVPLLKDAGFEVYCPNLRYHDLPLQEGLNAVARLSLADYVADIKQLLVEIKQPVWLVGHSLGGLIAQLVATQNPSYCKGLILLGPAPMAGIFSLYPSMFLSFYKHFLQWGFWKKPVLPNKNVLKKYCMNEQSTEIQNEVYASLVADSGRAYAEMVFWFLDPRRTSKVYTQNFDAPVLVVSGTEDKVVVSNIAKATANRYKNSSYILMQGADHSYAMGRYLPQTVQHMLDWIKKHSF